MAGSVRTLTSTLSGLVGLGGGNASAPPAATVTAAPSTPYQPPPASSTVVSSAPPPPVPVFTSHPSAGTTPDTTPASPVPPPAYPVTHPSSAAPVVANPPPSQAALPDAAPPTAPDPDNPSGLSGAELREKYQHSSPEDIATAISNGELAQSQIGIGGVSKIATIATLLNATNPPRRATVDYAPDLTSTLPDWLVRRADNIYSQSSVDAPTQRAASLGALVGPYIDDAQALDVYTKLGTPEELAIFNQTVVESRRLAENEKWAAVKDLVGEAVTRSTDTAGEIASALSIDVDTVKQTLDGTLDPATASDSTGNLQRLLTLVSDVKLQATEDLTARLQRAAAQAARSNEIAEQLRKSAEQRAARYTRAKALLSVGQLDDANDLRFIEEYERDHPPQAISPSSTQAQQLRRSKRSKKAPK